MQTAVVRFYATKATTAYWLEKTWDGLLGKRILSSFSLVPQIAECSFPIQPLGVAKKLLF